MKQNLTKRQSITVDQLRADRELLPDLRGEISDELRGEISCGLRGNLSYLRGEISRDLTGNLSGLFGEIHRDLRGEITGLRGDATAIIGKLDECELTDEERKAGVDICDLVKT